MVGADEILYQSRLTAPHIRTDGNGAHGRAPLRRLRHTHTEWVLGNSDQAIRYARGSARN
jgi:hypothetical protein